MKKPYRFSLALLAFFILSASCGNAYTTNDNQKKPPTPEELYFQSLGQQNWRAEIITQELRDYNQTSSPLSTVEQAELRTLLEDFFATGESGLISDYTPDGERYNHKYKKTLPFLLRFRYLFGQGHPAETEFLELYTEVFRDFSEKDSKKGRLLFFGSQHTQSILEAWTWENQDRTSELERLETLLPEIFTPAELTRGWGRWYENRANTNLTDLLHVSGEAVLFCHHEKEIPVSEPHLDLVPIHAYYLNHYPEDSWEIMDYDLVYVNDYTCARTILPEDDE